MDRLLTTAIIAYALGVLTGLYHEELKHYLMIILTGRIKNAKKELKKEIKEVDVMGKSFFIPQQLQPQTPVLLNTEKALIQVPNEELDKIFSEELKPENELLDIEVKLEYEDELEMNEEIELIFGKREGELATGVTFDELGQIHEALQKKCLSKEEKTTIKNIARKVLQTDLFEMMVWQSQATSRRVNEVLQDLFEDKPSTESGTGKAPIDQQKLDNFQIADFV
jgi:hypothetical protein